MTGLKTVGKRFEIPMIVVEGGSGIVNGILSETDQAGQPSYVFVQPRHIFRAAYPTAVKPGMVLRTRIGTNFIVGANGPSETWRGTLWQSFRLFEPTGLYRWTRRTKVVDPITRLETDTGIPEDLGMIYAALEPLDREQTDRDMRQNFEQLRFIAGAPVRSDDLLDNRSVTKVDKQLGLAIGVLT